MIIKALLAVALALFKPDIGQETALEYAGYFILAADETGEDALLLAAVAAYESHLETDSESHSGYCGLMQCPSKRPGTWRRNKPTCAYWKTHPAENVLYGAQELADLRETWPETKDVLCRYSLGPRKKCPRKTMRTYVRGVLWTYDFMQRAYYDRPYGEWVCTIRIPLPDGVIQLTDGIEIYGGPGEWSGRRYIREYRSSLLKRLKRQLKVNVCKLWGGDDVGVNDCMHTAGRTYDCAFAKGVQGE